MSGYCWRGNYLQIPTVRGALGAIAIAIARGQLAVHVHVQPTSGHECLPTSGLRPLGPELQKVNFPRGCDFPRSTIADELVGVR